jgi:hypothetical protein
MTYRAVPVWLAGGLCLAPAACTLVHEDAAGEPHTYLEQAKQAAAAHDAPRTIAALNEAERLWVANNGSYGNPAIDTPAEVLTQIFRARQAVQMGRWSDANYYIAAALTHPSTIIPP